MGPFTVVALVGPVAVCLVLTMGSSRGCNWSSMFLCFAGTSLVGMGSKPPPPIVVDEVGTIRVSRPCFHTEFKEGSDSTLYARGATTTAKTVG